MSYYLLLWNPASEKTITKSFDLDQGRRSGSWSCGNAKGVRVGDTVILRKTGRGTRGIVGMGTVTRGSYESRWSHSGEVGLFVDVEWNTLENEPILTQEDAVPESSLWKAQSGGVQISDQEGELLEELVFWSFLPSTDDFVSYWIEQPPTEAQRRMLATHYWCPDEAMHPGYLSAGMGWPNAASANLHYGLFAGATASRMGVTLPANADKVALFAAIVRPSGDVLWLLHDQVREAIARLHWHTLGGAVHTYHDQERSLIAEGYLTEQTVTSRERDRSVRLACLNHHSPICVACGFDPGALFGEAFRHMIDIHHLDPIAASEPGRLTDPEIDCRPLCPTCHRLAHHGLAAGKCRTIDELKALLRGRFSSAK
ncbi:hypothetical protein [Hyphomicrobium sp.]|uniref:HNH endonuclease n=1 Tax=Hyphomicrobium sp. TaxID=82 RepID=UPI002D76A10A|nr:hypothetical protein [Hyphomicrobium sp.]HET6387922.1 hypothetical protein [Hyphomicrobium sp.]